MAIHGVVWLSKGWSKIQKRRVNAATKYGIPFVVALQGGGILISFSRQMRRRGNGFDASELMDVAFTGYEYTWCNGRGGEENIQEG